MSIAAILAKLDDLFLKVMSDPEFKANCKKNNMFLLPMDGPEYAKYLADLQVETQYYFDKNPW